MATIYIQQEALKKGEKYIPRTATVKAFVKSCTVAKGVQVLHIGGHATGSSVVNIQWDGLSYTVVGDECYTAACVELGIPTGVSRDPEKSLHFLREYAERPLLYCHDPSVLPGTNGFLQIF